MNKVFKYLGCWLAITLAFGTWMWIDDDISDSYGGSIICIQVSFSQCWCTSSVV